MKKFLSLILATAMIATLFIGTSVFAAESSSSSSAEEEGSTDTYVFTYATVDAEGSDHDRLVESKLKELLEEKSGGRMTLEVYYSSSLTGVGSTLDGIKDGTVDMGYDACGFYGAVFPYTELFSVPCLYFGDSYEASEVLREFDKVYTDEVLEDYHIMARFIGETMCLFVKDADPIKSPADVAGKTFRTTGSNQALIEACGGAGQGMPSADVYEALRLNVIDGAVSNFGALITFNYGEVTKACTPLPMIYSEGTVFMNKDLYESMNEYDQKIFDEVCEEFQASFMDYNAWNKENVENYIKENYPDFIVYELTDEEIAEFVKLGEANLEKKAKELDELGLDGTGAMEWLKEHAK